MAATGSIAAVALPDQVAVRDARTRPEAAGSAVALAGVSLSFGSTLAVNDVTLDVAPGEILFLLGPSGSGKSSLLRLVAGLERPDRGTIVMNGHEVAGPARFVEPEDRRVGMVFQDSALFPHLTITANVEFGLRTRRAAADGTVGALLQRLDIARYAASYPHMLSGGERQRVALARALAPQPRVLLMDEPFSSLDGRLRDHVRQETLGLLRDLGTTTIVVTHDPQEALRAADRIALLCAGRLLQCGTPEALYTFPATAFVARFFGDVNALPAVCRHGRADTILGSFAAPRCADGAPVRVCIRPQHLRLAGAPTDCRARVVATEFLGDREQVTLSMHALSTPLLLSTSGRSHLAPGDSVFLAVDTPHVVVVRDDDEKTCGSHLQVAFVPEPHSHEGRLI